MNDEFRAALLRYYGQCLRDELRAREVLRLREARTAVALRQLQQYDRDLRMSLSEALATARAAKRRNLAARLIRRPRREGS